MLLLYPTVGLAFLFVPINTLVYTNVPPEKNNMVAGIINLGRNMGGSIGIALATTMIARRAQAHQEALSRFTSNYNQEFTAKLNGVAQTLQHGGASATDAAHRALGVLYLQMQQQANQLAYIDVFRFLGFAAFLMLPLVFVAKSSKPGAPTMGH
jgi:DHA2 family multidrug resistance protein